MLSRRDLVGKLAAGAAGVVALAVSGKRARGAVAASSAAEPSKASQERIPEGPEVGAVQDDRQGQGPEQMPAPWDLLRPLSKGAPVAHGWRLADLTGPVGGACVLTLENQIGRIQRVHLCRNDGRPQGLVYTGKLDLVVMNGGQGDLGTEEGFAQAVAAVSHVLAANESSIANAHVMDALLPHAERLRRYAAASEWTLR